MKIIKLCAVAAIGLIGCGDNKSNPDAKVTDGKTPDAIVFPAAPQLGTQIDRMGRAAANTVLNHGFDGTTGAEDAKEAYNAQTSRTDWQMNVPEFVMNLGIIDVLDSGTCGNGICEAGEAHVGDTNAGISACVLDCPGATQVGGATVNGCGNQALYNFNGGTGPMEASYGVLASVLANDELFLDSAKSMCDKYLAVEAGLVLGDYSSCGGRAPDYDVIDYSLSMLAMGLKGFDANLDPLFHDNAEAHDDLTATFPYLGPPHVAP